jgi:hypothetical protein
MRGPFSRQEGYGMDHLIIMDRGNIGGKSQINFTCYMWVISKQLLGVNFFNGRDGFFLEIVIDLMTRVNGKLING